LQFPEVCPLGIHAFKGEVKSALFERVLYQSGVAGLVLDDQNA